VSICRANVNPSGRDMYGASTGNRVIPIASLRRYAPFARYIRPELGTLPK
jgi:hypothetical protein